MTVVNYTASPKMQFNQGGVPLAGGKLFTYISGTTTKQATYTDATGGTPNANPIVLDVNGQCDLWLVAGENYTLVLSPSTDTDPPTNPYWTENGISSGPPISAAMAPVIGAASIAAAVALLGVLPLTGGALTGPLTSAQAGTFDNAAMHIGTQFILNSLSPLAVYQLTHSGKFATIGEVVGVAIPNTSTQYEADAFAAYVTNASTTTGAAAGSFYALNLASGVTSWALNPLVDDQGHLSTVVGLECDIGASNTGSTAIGCNMIGVFPSGAIASAVAYQVSVLNSAWGYSFVSFDGAASNFALVGAAGTSANTDGQPIQFNARDNTNTVRSAGIQALHTSNGCDLHVSTPTGSFTVSGGSSFAALAGFAQGISVVALSTVLEGFLSGSTGVGSITTNGSTTAYNTSSDYRIKTTFGPYDPGTMIDLIPVYDAEYKALPGERRPMMLAHEIAAGGAHWAVIGEKDAVDDDGKVKLQQVDYSSLIPSLWAEVKALRARVAVLEAKP